MGGEAVNEVMALSKLGVNAGILCFLGMDMAGRMIESTLEQCGAICTTAAGAGTALTDKAQVLAFLDGKTLRNGF